MERADYEYVIVGSGAGGGTLAARLAEAGKSVVLLEAGGDPKQLTGGCPFDPASNRMPDDYSVPVFHPFASENEAIKWDFFVRHYADQQLQRSDPKYRDTVDGRPVDGILYPRAGTLGGCTAHNAMIFVYPHNADWEEIATLTGDPSWRAENMRTYFSRLENCRHRPIWRWLDKVGINPSRHGWNGWLQTELAIPAAGLENRHLMDVIAKSACAAFNDVGRPLERVPNLAKGECDPNDWRMISGNAEGLCYTPLTTRDHRRMGARERVLEVAEKFPDRLRVVLNALATRVLFDNENRALGVEYLSGERLYRAHSRFSDASGERRQIHASREVILAGGAFNTPQLLMLSGIGSRAKLARHGIDVRVELDGVGMNLQDRYEIGVVNRMASDWQVLNGARFVRGDPLYQDWARSGSGMYGTNGAGIAVIKRSTADRALPDLFCMAILGLFKGYFPGYSSLIAEHHNYLTWAILKAHTNNRSGEVSLRSADPREPPEINFHYFEESTDRTEADLISVVDGVRFARRMAKPLKQAGLIAEEELPGDHVQSDDALKDFVKRNAWGHHASCSCAIGPRGQKGVLTSDFKVHGTRGLRVVDASVFPRIPGFFIASAVYMVAEKAADVILSDTVVAS
jgi:choline dehydrogenase